MMASKWALCIVSILALNQIGCGKPVTEAPPPPVKDPLSMIKVKGNAAFGSHCSFGTYSPPNPVPLELYDCPPKLDSVELMDSLRPIVFQVDCKKRTIDVRGATRNPNTTNNPNVESWEFMPDGSFWFSVDAGFTQLTDDGSGNKNCVTPLTAEMWGRIDCTDMDRAKIHVETLWWLGTSYATGPSRTPSPTPSPTTSASPRPSTTPVPGPAPAPIPGPTGSPQPTPSVTASPAPSTQPSALPSAAPSATPTSRRAFAISNVPSGFPICKLPPAAPKTKGCFLHNISKLTICE